MEVKPITREEFNEWFNWTRMEDFLSRIQEVQSSEPMSRAGDCKKAFDDYYNAFKAGFSFTVKQGFVPDWSKAPKEATGVVIDFTDWTEAEWKERVSPDLWQIQYIPRPDPKMRPKTREEKIDDLRKNAVIMNWPTIGQLQDSTIDDLCRAAGISLEVEE